MTEITNGGKPVTTDVASAGQHGAQNKSRPHAAPESKVGEEGSARRNIARKGNSKQHVRVGGGNKGKWDPMDDGSEAVAVDGIADERDPNYDPDADEFSNNYVLVSDTPEGSGPMYTLPDFKRRLKTILEEYFLSEDVSEVLRSVKELESPAYHYEIVKRGINLSLDAKDHEVKHEMPPM